MPAKCTLLTALVQAQQERMADREVVIQRTSEKFKIKGFSSGLDSDKVIDFMSKLMDMHRKQKSTVEGLQVLEVAWLLVWSF